MDNQWILERWVSGLEFSQCNQEQWDRTRQADVLGPYPSRGEYVRCEVQLTCSPTDANLEKLVSWVEESRLRQMSASGPSINKVALKEAYDAETKANRQKQYDIINNAYSAFLDRPFVATSSSAKSAKRGTKTKDFLRSAEQLGLPSKGGKVFQLPKRARKQIA